MMAPFGSGFAYWTRRIREENCGLNVIAAGALRLARLTHFSGRRVTMKNDDIRERTDSEEKQRGDYAAPEVITYSGDRLLEEMGPARACGASVPACPISD